MSHVTYEIVEHDDGWAYKLGDVFSERFDTRDEAQAAAEAAAQRQQRTGESEEILYQDANYAWHREHAEADDRPEADVTDQPGGATELP